MNNIEKIRNNLVELMSLRKITQYEVAKAIGVTQGGISLFINGERGLGGNATLALVSFLEQHQQDSPKDSQNAT